jgi:hypothetical protein
MTIALSVRKSLEIPIRNEQVSRYVRTKISLVGVFRVQATPGEPHFEIVRNLNDSMFELIINDQLGSESHWSLQMATNIVQRLRLIVDAFRNYDPPSEREFLRRMGRALEDVAGISTVVEIDDQTRSSAEFGFEFSDRPIVVQYETGQVAGRSIRFQVPVPEHIRARLPTIPRVVLPCEFLGALKLNLGPGTRLLEYMERQLTRQGLRTLLGRGGIIGVAIVLAVGVAALTMYIIDVEQRRGRLRNLLMRYVAAYLTTAFTPGEYRPLLLSWDWSSARRLTAPQLYELQGWLDARSDRAALGKPELQRRLFRQFNTRPGNRFPQSPPDARDILADAFLIRLEAGNRWNPAGLRGALVY